MTMSLLRRVGLPSLLLALTAACGLLDTETPDIIQPGDVESPEGAQARRAGALADWAFVRDGDGTEFVDGEILLTGLMADEFVLSTTPPGEQEVDQRRISGASIEADSLFLLTQRVRAEAEDAADALQRLSPLPDEEPGIPEMFAVAGYSYISLGEVFCSGVPISRVQADTIAFGQPETTQQIFDRAIASFDAALAHPAIGEDVLGLATVGKARALLDRDTGTDVADAAALVASVPTESQYVTEHAESPQRNRNAIFQYGQDFLWSLSDLEGGNGLPFRSAEDPRVPFTDAEDVGLDGTTPQFILDKYPDATASVVVADGIEARLIEAEAQLRANNFSGMRTTLNDLRDFADLGLDPLPTPGNHDAAVDQLFSERAFWLFATGHRLGDLRRLVRQYLRAPDDVFPTGDYLKGGPYGTDVNFPIPRSEDSNNPNSDGCLNRDA
jgi:starch-binding outer membrane protein, SusD/RagB family